VYSGHVQSFQHGRFSHRLIPSCTEAHDPISRKDKHFRIWFLTLYLAKRSITFKHKLQKTKLRIVAEHSQGGRQNVGYFTDNFGKTKRPSATTSQVNCEKAYLLSRDVTHIACPQFLHDPIIRGSIVLIWSWFLQRLQKP